MRLLTIFAVLVAASFGIAADREKAKDVDPVRKKASEKRFEKLKEYLKERRVTHIVELLAEWGEFADATHQDDLMAMAAALFEDAKEEAGRGIVAPRIGYRGTSNTTKVKNVIEDASAYFVDEFDVAQPPGVADDRFKGLGEHVVTASRSLTAFPNRGREAANCLLLSNAAAVDVEGLTRCIVLASGSVVCAKSIRQSVVVCRGDVEYEFGRQNGSLVKAGGRLVYAREMADALRKAGNPLPEPPEGLTVEKDTKLLGVKFYSATEDGLTATAKKVGVSVNKLDAKKPFATAGVKEGDVIETINGEKVPTLHELDRLLCRATVASGTARLKLKRGDKAEVIEVKLADW